MDMIQTAAQDVLVSLALGTLALAAAYVSYYLSRLAQNLKTKTLSLQDEEARKVLLQALEDAERLARTAVEAIEQTAAKTIREAVQEGDMNRESLLALGQKAFDDLKSRITPQAQQVITKNLGDFDTYLKDLIEAEVYRLKQSSIDAF